MSRQITTLGYALLGLLHQKPCTGYDLRKIFAETPFMSFSESPGSIYPALRRLEEKGDVRGRIQQGSGMRRRKVFRITPAGLGELKEWLEKPVGRDDVIRGTEELMLRFAFMDQILSRAQIVGFLKALDVEFSSYVALLKEHLASFPGDVSLTGRAALESGIESYQARIGWTRRVVAMLQPSRTRGES
jgi:DNA-binding PadR family transcriptional regulator